MYPEWMEWKSLWVFVIYLSTLIRLMSVLCVTLDKVSETQCEWGHRKGSNFCLLGRSVCCWWQQQLWKTFLIKSVYISSGGAFAYHVWSLGLFIIHTDLVLLCVCVCVHLDPRFIFTLFVYMDWTVCRGQRGGGSATVNKGRIVRKTGCYLWSRVCTTAVGVKANWCFFGIASTSLQLNYSNMTKSRHPLQTKGNVTILHFIGLTPPHCGL